MNLNFDKPKVIHSVIHRAINGTASGVDWQSLKRNGYAYEGAQGPVLHYQVLTAWQMAYANTDGVVRADRAMRAGQAERSDAAFQKKLDERREENKRSRKIARHIKAAKTARATHAAKAAQLLGDNHE